LAFSVAHQYRGVVNSQEMGYHQDFAKYSPGKVLLYLIIRDLHADGSVRLLNFGMGDAEYKRWFADIERTESSWLLLRRSLRNRLLTRSHAAFDGAVELAKRIVRR
jgi:CelD/BcsL family acetyltransferase involved in cellulose biosynthesis